MASSTILHRFDFLILASFLLSNSCGLVTSPSDESITSGTWEIVRAKQDEITYYSIHFVDANVGWIVGEDGTIQNTVDGGISWDSQTSGVTSWLWDVQFIDNQTGWICGANNTILRTQDGGHSWSNISTIDLIDKIYTGLEFISPDIGWISSNHGEILRTSDGGLTWELKKFFEMGGGSRLSALDANTIYALHGRLYRSYDAGETWDSLTISTPDYFRASQIFFTDRNNGWANTMSTSGGLMDTSQPVVSTNDGGLTWSHAESLNDDFFECTYFINKNIGWVAGPQIIYKTNDGGDHWTLESTRDDIYYGAKDMMFIDKNHGWLLNYRGDVFRYLGDGK
ncbi:WD40/YVTN/BNR-like repeat-containing protein [Candidatus Neomarinimicrobiota bacterium]